MSVQPSLPNRKEFLEVLETTKDKYGSRAALSSDGTIFHVRWFLPSFCYKNSKQRFLDVYRQLKTDNPSEV